MQKETYESDILQLNTSLMDIDALRKHRIPYDVIHRWTDCNGESWIAISVDAAHVDAALGAARATLPDEHQIDFSPLTPLPEGCEC